MIPETAEEYCLFLQGENLALNLAVRALLESHPDKPSLADALSRLQARANDAMKRVPPAESDVVSLRAIPAGTAQGHRAMRIDIVSTRS